MAQAVSVQSKLQQLSQSESSDGAIADAAGGVATEQAGLEQSTPQTDEREDHTGAEPNIFACVQYIYENPCSWPPL